MNNDGEYTIFCPKCGNEMKNTSRYCMKCGHLNIDHPDNKNVSKYFEDSGNTIVNNYNGKYIMTNNALKNIDHNFMKKNSRYCFIFNLITFLLTVICFSVIYYRNNGGFSNVLSSNVWSIFIVIPLMYIYCYAYELLFIKMGYSWWKALIPIYNVMLISKKVFDNMFLGLIIIVPIIGQIYLLVLMYKLATKFNRNGLLMVLFPFIMIPLISFSEDLYEKENDSGNFDYESTYGMKKKFLILCSIFLLIGLLMLLFKFPIIDYFKNKWNEVQSLLK